MSGDHNQHQADQCEHLWRYIGSKRQAVWQCPHCESLRFVEPPARDCYGDGNVYRGERSRDSEVKTVWVSLTDDEIAEAVGSPLDEVYLTDFRKVEAKLKEKNTHATRPNQDICGND